METNAGQTGFNRWIREFLSPVPRLIAYVVLLALHVLVMFLVTGSWRDALSYNQWLYVVYFIIACVASEHARRRWRNRSRGN